MNLSSLARRSGLAAAAVAAGVLVAPGAASATLFVDSAASTPGALVIGSSDGAPENIVVTVTDTPGVVIQGVGYDIDGAGTRCTAAGNTATCLGVGLSDLVLGNGNDTVTIRGEADIDTDLRGGGGDDTIVKETDMATVDGGPGNDRISAGGSGSLSFGDTGGAGDDRFVGSNSEADIFFAEFGADSYSGGTVPNVTAPDSQRAFARDQMIYQGPTPVTVSLDNAANDGGAGEGDNVQTDIELVVGGSGGDTIDASGFSSYGGVELRGYGGDDTLIGSSADDSLWGGEGNDTVNANAGDDSLASDNGADMLSGGEGDDRLGSDFGNGELLGGTQPAADVNDRMDGGEGDDSFALTSSVCDMPTGTVQEGELGANDVIGGPGEDSVSVMASRFSGPNCNGQVEVGVNVSLDDAANDGVYGANIHTDIESVSTGGGDDTLTGSEGSNLLYSGRGNDTIDPKGGIDLVDAGRGTDTINARDLIGDRINCGGDIDNPVIADDIDALIDCEGANDIAAVPPKLVPVFDTVKAQLKIGGANKIKRKTFKKKRTISVTVTTNEKALTLGSVTSSRYVKGQNLILASKDGKAATGKRTVKFKISKKRANRIYKLAGTKKYRRKGFPVVVRINAIDGGGNVTKKTRTVRITRK